MCTKAPCFKLSLHLHTCAYFLVILISIFNNKLAVITLSNKVKLFDAVPITKKIVEKLGGKGGGGKADLAQGGAADISKIKLRL